MTSYSARAKWTAWERSTSTRERNSSAYRKREGGGREEGREGGRGGREGGRERERRKEREGGTEGREEREGEREGKRGKERNGGRVERTGVDIIAETVSNHNLQLQTEQ